MNIFTTSILYCKQDKVPQELLLQTTVLRVISESNAPKLRNLLKVLPVSNLPLGTSPVEARCL